MDAITFTNARTRLADIMRRVCVDHEPIIITRKDRRAVVMMSIEHFNSIEESSYLLRSRKNAQRLLASIASLESCDGKARSPKK